jgi:hypothetical protein
MNEREELIHGLEQRLAILNGFTEKIYVTRIKEELRE